MSRVIFVCPIFKMYPQIISSLICQTAQDWELLLMHNGPNITNNLDRIVERYAEPRVKLVVHPEETGQYGHALRKWALEEIKATRIGADAEYAVITNADNYYMPSFIERMIAGFTPDTVATYCRQMVHNYGASEPWGVMKCVPAVSNIDCGGVMIRKDIASDVGWRSLAFASDWTYFEDVINKYGIERWTEVPGCLFVHN